MPADRVRIRVTHKTPPSSTGEEGGLGFLRRLFLVTSPNPDGGGWDGRQVVSFVVTLGASAPVPPQSVSQSVSQSEPSTVGREQRAYYTRVGVLSWVALRRRMRRLFRGAISGENRRGAGVGLCA